MTISERKTSRAVSSIGIFASKVLAQPFTIVASLVVANYLGPDEKGLAALSRVLPTFFASLAGLGIASSLKHVIGRKDHSLSEVGCTSILLSLIQGLGAAGIFLLLIQTGMLGGRAMVLPGWVKLLAALLIPMSVLRHTLAMGFAGHMDFRIPNIINLCAGILFAAISAILVVFKGYGFGGVFLSFFISVLFAVACSCVIFLKKYVPCFEVNREFIAYSYHYGLRAYLGTLAKRTNTSLDQFFLGVLAPARALGNYSVALSIANFLFFLPQSIAPVLVNVIAELRGSTDGQKVAQVHRAVLIMQLGAGACIAALGYLLIPIVLPEFGDVPNLILVLLPGALFLSSFQILEAVFSGMGKPGRASWCHVLAVVWSLITYPILVPKFGGIGAAAACSVNYFAMYIMIVWMYGQLLLPEQHRLFAFSWSDIRWIFQHAIEICKRLSLAIKKRNTGAE